MTTDEDAAVDEDTSSPKWLLFEQMIAAAERQLDKNADVEHDQDVLGQKSKTMRQIDVLARGKAARAGLDVVIECKRYKRRLGIGKVDEMVGKLQDVGAHHGVLYAYSGVKKPACARAEGARRLTIEIRDFDETQAELERVAATLTHAGAGTSVSYAELIAGVAAEFGEKLARDVERHLSYNCEAGTGCIGVVDVASEDGEIPWGTCDHCSSLHIVCACDESLFFIHGRGEEECWCGARYQVTYTPEAELRGIDLTRHGVDCDGAHAPNVPSMEEPEQV